MLSSFYRFAAIKIDLPINGYNPITIPVNKNEVNAITMQHGTPEAIIPKILKGKYLEFLAGYNGSVYEIIEIARLGEDMEKENIRTIIENKISLYNKNATPEYPFFIVFSSLLSEMWRSSYPKTTTYPKYTYIALPEVEAYEDKDSILPGLLTDYSIEAVSIYTTLKYPYIYSVDITSNARIGITLDKVNSTLTAEDTNIYAITSRSKPLQIVYNNTQEHVKISDTNVKKEWKKFTTEKQKINAENTDTYITLYLASADSTAPGRARTAAEARAAAAAETGAAATEARAAAAAAAAAAANAAAANAAAANAAETPIIEPAPEAVTSPPPQVIGGKSRKTKRHHKKSARRKTKRHRKKSRRNKKTHSRKH
jgi:hypothetical protein